MFALSCAVVMYFLSSTKSFDNYSFLGNLKYSIESTIFENPIDSTKEILDKINQFNNSYNSVSGGNLWEIVSNISSNIVNFFNIIISYISIPFEFLKDIAVDILAIFQVIFRFVRI